MPKKRKSHSKRGGFNVSNLTRGLPIPSKLPSWSQVHDGVKDLKVVSTIARNVDPRLGQVAQIYGYGSNPRIMRGQGQVGGWGFFESFGNSLGNLGKSILKVPGTVLAGSSMGLNAGIDNLGMGRRGGMMQVPIVPSAGMQPASNKIQLL